jgi:hypothetical protein
MKLVHWVVDWAYAVAYVVVVKVGEWLGFSEDE